MRVDRYGTRRKELLESRDAVKAARPVRRGDDGKGTKSYLASVLPYFLALTADYNERDLERGLVEHITQILLELGAGFAYVGRQVALQVSDREFFLDLLFYHVQLHCYVVIELKTSDFEPKHAGKLNFYLKAVDEQLRREGDAPSIGLLLCKQRDRLVVEWALSDIHKPIGISEYQLARELPDEIQSSLPTNDRAARSQVELLIKSVS